MNRIEIYAPRWHDRSILVAAWKVGPTNQIEITSKKKDGSRYYPEPFEVTAGWLNQFPVEDQPHGKMIKVPLDKLLETR